MAKETQHNKEEEHISALADRTTHDDGLSHEQERDDDAEYSALIALFDDARDSITPDPAALHALIGKIPPHVTSSPREAISEEQDVVSPYIGTVNWLFSRASSWKAVTPVAAMVLVLVVIIGASSQKGTGTLPVTRRVQTETIAPIADTNAHPAPFAVNEPERGAMMTAKMSESTVPSTTPQNVGEVVALLSIEADSDVDLGVADMNDPLYSADQISVDALEQPYDIQTI